MNQIMTMFFLFVLFTGNFMDFLLPNESVKSLLIRQFFLSIYHFFTFLQQDFASSLILFEENFFY